MLLWEEYPEFKKTMVKIEEEIKNGVKSRQPLVQRASTELVEAGGKRLRPALVLLAHDFGNEKNKNIDKLAASIEILHMATLVHDDIIDESKTRRGEATTQAKWGKGIAVFTGDFLLSKAFLNISNYSINKDISRISHIAKSICEGEVEQFDSRFNMDITLKQYLWRIKCKTAHLFAFSCWLGAVESKASKNVINSLKRYGNHLGMAFQISDDILDFTGSESKVGKPLGSDIKNGIFTLPVIYALKKGENPKELKKLLSKSEFTPKEVKEIIQRSIQEGGLEYTKSLLMKYINKAKKELDKLPVTNYTPLLYEMVEQIENREY